MDNLEFPRFEEFNPSPNSLDLESKSSIGKGFEKSTDGQRYSADNAAILDFLEIESSRFGFVASKS